MGGGGVYLKYEDKACCICDKVQSSCSEPTKCNRCNLFHGEYIEHHGPTCPYTLGRMYRAGKLSIHDYKYKPEDYEKRMRKLIHDIITKE